MLRGLVWIGLGLRGLVWIGPVVRGPVWIGLALSRLGLGWLGLGWLGWAVGGGPLARLTPGFARCAPGARWAPGRRGAPLLLLLPFGAA